MRVVVDTNVVVSGLINPYGAPGSLLALAAAGDLTPCYDARILAEYREVLLRPRLGFDPPRVEALLAFIEGEGEPTMAAPLPHRLPDASDEMFLEVALAARADCLITGNRGKFPARLCLGMKVLSPAEFLEGLRGRP